MNMVKNSNSKHLQESSINYTMDKSMTERRQQKEVTLKPIKLSGTLACLSQITLNLHISKTAVAQSAGG